jgi:short-subunit dehydrogenase
MEKPSRYIVVTGATGGIGSAIVAQAIAAGFIVIAVGSNETKLKELEQRFGNESVIPYRIDLAELGTYAELSRFIEDKAGKIEWVVHSAGYISTDEPLLKPDVKTIKETFLINTESVIALTYYLLPLITQEGGVICISSTASLWGNPRFPIYAASKAALNTFAQSMARHFRNTEQSSIVVCPGPTNTALRERVAGDAKEQQSPQAVAGVVATILNRNSPYGNGDVVVVQGGVEKLHSKLNFSL